MTNGDSSLTQSRLDEAVGNTSMRSHSSLASAKPPRPSNTSGADPTDVAGDASIAFSDHNSERPSKPRSQAPSQRAPSVTGSVRAGSRGPSETNFAFGSSAGQGAAAVDDEAASLAFSDRSSRPRTSAPQPASPAMSQRAPSVTSVRGGAGGGSRLASETNFAFGGAEDDDGASSVSMSDRPSKPRSVQAQEARSPSLSGGGGGSAGGALGVSRSSLGGDIDFGGDDNDGAASVARSSKARGSAAPSQRAPSVSGGVGGGASGGGSGSRKGSDSGLGFSGFSTQGGKDEVGGEDGDGAASTHAASSARKGRSGSIPPSPAASQRAPSSNGGASRKTSEVNPSAGGGGGISSGVSGLGESAIAGDTSIAFSDTASEVGGKAASVAGSAAGGGASRSSRPSATSGAVSGAILYSKDADDADTSAAPPSRRRSFASSLRESVASHKTASAAGSDESDGGGGGPGGDDAVSTRSGVSAASGKSRSSAAVLSKSASVASGRSAQTSSVAASSSKRTTERTATSKSSATNDYGDDDFEEEVAEDDEEEEEEEEDTGGSGSGGDEAAASESVVSGSKRSSAAGSRPVSGSSRVSTARSGVSRNGGYSNDFEGGSGRQSATAGEEEEEAAAAAAAAVGGSIFRGSGGSGGPASLHISGSIVQGDNATPGSRRSGGSVFRRLPADAPDDAASADGGDGRQLARSGSSFRSGSQADADAAGGEWNEGAVRVAAPGAPRPFSSRHDAGGVYGSRPRPMSAAPRDRQGAVLDALTRKHPGTWDATDVATWVEFLGLGQYRRRFLHHCIDGRLLLRITDAQLKSDLGIGPVGHRYAILDAAATLVKDFKEAQRERLAAGGGAGSDAGDSDGNIRKEYGRSSTAPRSRPRPASAMPGALTTAPPPPPSHGPRRPASASRSVIPPDPFLGPAMGKVTVYEQRAKLLFELDRAQARAEQHRALAEQLQYTATLSADEVNHIRGLLTEIERKNRQAFELSGGVDSAARVPWRHVGNGTKHNNWNPERFARPGEPETVDLTFQPRCTNPESRKLLGLGGGDYGEHPSAVNSFLDRLNNDLRKREQSRKELERRYYSDGSANPNAQADADFQVVAEALQQRCHIAMDRDPAEYEVQIDEALDKLANGESWREAGLKDAPIRAAKGPAKLAAAASALRSLAFMERYRSDLRSKGSRARALEKKWINQTLGAQYLPGGKDKEDLEEAAGFFALLGWRDGDGGASEDAVDPDLLDRLLSRAVEYRKKYDAWWERVRDKPEERAAGFKCDINWRAHPWDSDGLAQLMDAELHRMGEASGGPSDFVEFTVRLLGKCREDDLHRLQSLGPRPKRLGVYRAIRTQKFIEFTQKDLEERDRKLREAYQALAPSRRKLEPSRIEGFFERLVEDAAKRRAKAEKIAHDKVLKEQEILASSVMYGRSRKVR